MRRARQFAQHVVLYATLVGAAPAESGQGRYREVWESPIYEQFLRAVREVNLALPREQRIRVIAGDSPIDWPRITRAEDLAPLLNRGGNIRQIISRELLDPKIKGLAIYGAGHCSKLGGGFPGDLYGKYPERQMWSIYPVTSTPPVRARLGDRPTYLRVAEPQCAAFACGIIAEPPSSSARDVADALVYHGTVPDSVVRADLAVLNTKYAGEFARRAKLLEGAYALVRGRPRPTTAPPPFTAVTASGARSRLTSWLDNTASTNHAGREHV